MTIARVWKFRFVTRNFDIVTIPQLWFTSIHEIFFFFRACATWLGPYWWFLKTRPSHTHAFQTSWQEWYGEKLSNNLSINKSILTIYFLLFPATSPTAPRWTRTLRICVPSSKSWTRGCTTLFNRTAISVTSTSATGDTHTLDQFKTETCSCSSKAGPSNSLKILQCPCSMPFPG